MPKTHQFRKQKQRKRPNSSDKKKKKKLTLVRQSDRQAQLGRSRAKIYRKHTGKH